MQFDSLAAFIDMGGYSFYVWLSYGVTLLVLASLYINSKVSHHKTKQLIIKRLQREERLHQAARLNAERAVITPTE